MQVPSLLNSNSLLKTFLQRSIIWLYAIVMSLYHSYVVTFCIWSLYFVYGKNEETKESEHRYGILHIWISLGTKFQLKLINLIFLDEKSLKKNRSEKWAKYGQWCYRFKFLKGIRLHRMFHAGFGELRFLKWREVTNSNSWFLAILKGFLEGTPLFKIIFLSQRRTLRSETIFGNWKPFKNNDKCFLFHLKSSFCSPDI